MAETQTNLLALREEIAASIGSYFSKYDGPKSAGKKNNNPEQQKYAKINNIAYHNEYFYISGELLTDDLIKFDKRYFSDEHKGIIKPIIWGFETRISIDSLWHASNGLTKKMKESIENGLKVSFSNYAGLKNSLERFKSGRENEFNDRIFDEIYINLINVSFTKWGGYRSLVYFSASPFVQDIKYINFLSQYQKYDDKEYEDIYSRLCTLKMSDISDNLKAFTPHELIEYNVGQGNFSELISINGSKTNKIVFDPGFTYLDDHDNFPDAKKELKRLEAECYFISHFDLDHILGVIYLQDSQFCKNVLWISSDPIPKYTKLSAKRLIKFLHENAEFRIIKRLPNKNVFDFNNNIKIYKGTSTPSDINGTGIMISVSGANKNALLPGDCLYKYWDDIVVSSASYDYLIAPHHGCKTKWVRISTNQGSTVIVPVGKKQKKDYHHPNYDHLEELSSIGFSDIYITVDLRKTIDLKNYIPKSKTYREISLTSFPDKSPKGYIPLSL